MAPQPVRGGDGRARVDPAAGRPGLRAAGAAAGRRHRAAGGGPGLPRPGQGAAGRALPGPVAADGHRRGQRRGQFLAGTLGPLAAGTRLAGRVETAAAAAQALRDFAGWLGNEHAARFPDDAPFAIGEAAQARKLREVHCFTTTPAEFARIGEAQIEEITAP